ncbi:restriction endonuclease subunit S [Pediococcus acidilactici]|uniref:restriction endonuclease subunit S n=1 Tax=Pediococcus acidilactici TaxID=1254 RepID=UPI001109D5DC|nr:restriction endonuclease subunit S [Pediococcus acidilactici]KAF0341948.1 restriction endonuclease subunit S [Pediococcus acidilactici]TLP98223.1 restriction endonuclease subunit S [Pediococcus acidilactici]
MKDNQAKYPQLRFKGFTDPWEQRKLGKMGYTFTGLSGKTKEDFGHGNAKFVTYMNVFSSPVSNSEMVENVEVDSKQHQVEYGDVFFTTSSETPQEVGMSSVWLETAENIYLNSFCFGYHPMVEFDPYYLAFMLRSPVIRKKFMLLAQGISRYNISKNKVMEMLVPVPEIVEQQKIGSFFKQLDDTITLHQRKLDLLKEQKKGYLQKMFPKNGAKVPELRFAGFADAWEQRKLIEVADYRNGKAHEKDISENGDYIVVNSKFVSTNGAVKKFSDELIAPLKKGELAFVLSDVPNGRAIARTFLIDEDNKYSLNQRIAGITPHSDTNSYFLHSLMNRHHYFLRFDDGAGQTNLSKKEVENWTELYPSIEEQDKIGSFFKQLDDTITLHQRKLDLLKEQKKSFLQNMFV